MPSSQPPCPTSTTCIGPGAILRGDLTIETEAVIHGRFEGAISGPGALIIRVGGSVKGTIAVARVLVEGAVEGDITAAALTIAESASVSGQVRCGPAAGHRANAPVAPSTLPAPAPARGEPSIIIEPNLARTLPGPAPVAPSAAMVQDIETTLAIFERTLADFMATKTPTATS